MKINLFDDALISFVHDIKPNGEHWQSKSDDPYFIMDTTEVIKPGWHKIELELRTTTPGQPKVYFDLDQPYTEALCAYLQETAPGHYQSVVKLDKKLKGLRLDPVEAVGKFEIDSFTAERVSGLSFYGFAMAKAAKLIASDPKKNFGRVFKAGMSMLRPRQFRAVRPEAVTEIVHVDDPYINWQNRYDYISTRHKAALVSKVDGLKDTPKISVVMPVYNTPAALLEKTIQSVIGQVYPNWELCICDDASPAPHVAKQLSRWAAKDSRIKVTTREENGHISKASNSALELVTSDWVALLDHDDVLRENALAEIALAINKNSDCQIIYSDEDKIDDQGKRFDPHFKSDFSPELFRSMNYLNHLTVHRADNIRAVGGWDDDFVGSQDYDLNLRIWERIKNEHIIHVPKVLYHWRATKGSTALSIAEKGYTEDAALNALKQHLKRTDQDASILPIEGLPFYRTKYNIAEPKPLVSLIIPTKDQVGLLSECIKSIVEHTEYENYEIIIIDNNSEEQATLDYFAELKKSKTARVYKYKKPFNFSAINNFGVKKANGDILGLINNDLEIITPGWMTEMVSWAQQDRVGCVGAKLYFGNETVQHGGVILGIGGVAGHAHKYFHRDRLGYFSRLKVTQNLSAVTGACLFVRKSIYEDLGGLDEDNLTIAFNDIDFCLRVRKAGYVNVWTPFAEMYHYESISRGAEDNPEKIARFNAEMNYMRKTWSDELDNDPYYSPNLSHIHEDFSFRA